MGLVVSFLAMGEKPSVLAIFIRSLTIGWTPTQVTDLISCLGKYWKWFPSTNYLSLRTKLDWFLILIPNTLNDIKFVPFYQIPFSNGTTATSILSRSF
jgi:hypothetical protein